MHIFGGIGSDEIVAMLNDFGGDVDVSEKYVSPTILSNVKGTDLIMKEEIFGILLVCWNNS